MAQNRHVDTPLPPFHIWQDIRGRAHSTGTIGRWRLCRAGSAGSCSPALSSSWGRSSPDPPVYLRESSLAMLSKHWTQ